jgi:hypothetical protein
MVRLGSADTPDVLCLQELPVWALPSLERWSGMTAVSDVGARPKLPIELGRRITDLHHGVFRSAFTGQANAVLFRPGLRVAEHDVVVLNPLEYRRREARRLRLGLVDRLAWVRERRVCQVVRVRREDDVTLVAANMHATSYFDKQLADSELLRAASFVDGYARPDEAVLLCGDLNVTVLRSRVLPQLLTPEWGFEGASPQGVDHVLSRGLSLGPPARWPPTRRRLDGRLLSDHAPLERRDS